MDGFEWVAELRDGIRGPANEAKAALEGLKGALGGADAALTKLNAHQEGMGKHGGGKFWEELGSGLGLQVTMGELAAKGIEMVADAAKEAVVGAAELVVELTKVAIEAGEFKRQTQEMFAGLGGGEDIGQATYEMLQQLRKDMPQSELQLRNWTAALMGAGETDTARLHNEVTALGSAFALMGGKAGMGAEAAAKVQTLMARALEAGHFGGKGGGKAIARQLIGTGITEKELAAQLGFTPEAFEAAFKSGAISASRGIDAISAVLATKGAGALQGEFLNIDTMWTKAKDNFSHLFDGIDAKPFLGQLASMFGLLDQSQGSGQALHVTMRGLFQGILDWATVAARSMYHAFLRIELTLLTLANHFAPVILALEKIGSAEMRGNLALVEHAIMGAAAGFEMIANAYTKMHGLEQSVARAVGLLPAERAPIAFAREGPVQGPPMLEKEAKAPPAGHSVVEAPAHQAGGVVAKPAPGEMFASVAPGEEIVPARGRPELKGGGDTIHHTENRVDVGGIHIHSEGGGQDSDETPAILESAIADIFARFVRELGGTTS